MRITHHEARKIADLAHLAFDDAALDRMASEMTKILTYIDQLAEVEIDETDGGRASARPTPLRDDTVGDDVTEDDRGIRWMRRAGDVEGMLVGYRDQEITAFVCPAAQTYNSKRRRACDPQ